MTSLIMASSKRPGRGIATVPTHDRLRRHCDWSGSQRPDGGHGHGRVGACGCCAWRRTTSSAGWRRPRSSSVATASSWPAPFSSRCRTRSSRISTWPPARSTSPRCSPPASARTASRRSCSTRIPSGCWSTSERRSGSRPVLGMAEVAAWAEAPARAIGRFDVRTPPKSLDEMWACAANEAEREAIRTAMFGSVMDVVDRFLPDPVQARAGAQHAGLPRRQLDLPGPLLARERTVPRFRPGLAGNGDDVESTRRSGHHRRPPGPHVRAARR